MSHMRRVLLATVVAVLAAVGLVATAGTAGAATGDIGVVDQSWSGATYSPTSDKPQSKLWYTDGTWYADMFDTVSKTWHIFRLDRGASPEVWVDTGVRIDDRANTLADVLWDGAKLYVASHVVTISSDSGSVASQPNSPARLYRYSYNAATKAFSLDAGFPATITTQSSESMTIDKDSTGKIFATWTQVSGSSTAGFTSRVYVNATTTSDSAWGTPAVVPGTAAIAPDDISAVVAYRGYTGVLWSSQVDDTVYWATHKDGDAVGTWKVGPAIRGNKAADDHLNVKALQADSQGRVYAVVKTSADKIAGAPTSTAQILVAVFRPGTGAWTSTTFGTLADCHTRPQLVLDSQHNTMYVVATAPSSGGCSFSGQAGTIYMKSASMDNPVFPSGRGTPIIRDNASANMNDPTTTKQEVSGASGLVVLANNTVTKRYWHADVSLGAAAPAPTASFTATPTSGTAPLAVSFTDTSTGSPTSWAWNFGDGSTASTQNPSHTYTAAGTYTATLTASNAGGASAPVTRTVTVTGTTPPPAGSVTAGSSTTATGATAGTAVTIARPGGVANGDVLIAQVTANANPSVSTAPAGWSTVVSPLSISTGATVFVYYHVVTNAAAEPASYTWQLSAAQKWNAVLSDFHGVNTTTPFDTAASTRVDTTYSATTVAVPGVTTVTAGAMLVGGVGLDSSATGVTPPSGWTEGGEGTGAQVAELAAQARPTAGATGTATWTLGNAAASAGWLRALRPA